MSPYFVWFPLADYQHLGLIPHPVALKIFRGDLVSNFKANQQGARPSRNSAHRLLANAHTSIRRLSAKHPLIPLPQPGFLQVRKKIRLWHQKFPFERQLSFSVVRLSAESFKLLHSCEIRLTFLRFRVPESILIAASNNLRRRLNLLR